MSVVISPSLVSNEYEFPLNHARIGYQDFVKTSTVTASTESAIFPADAVQRETTYERWQPTALPATLTIDSGTSPSGTASYLGIGAHTLGDNGNTVLLEYSHDATTWTTVDSVEPADNTALMMLFAEVQARYWRITISGGTAPTVGVVYLGQVLEMQRSIYGGHTPITLGRQTTIRPSVSEKGQWLGRSIVRNALATGYSFRHLTASWYRANFDPFAKAARSRPFFIAWRPETYPSEVAYGWTNDDITPSNMGVRDYMEVSFNVVGHADE